MLSAGSTITNMKTKMVAMLIKRDCCARSLPTQILFTVIVRVKTTVLNEELPSSRAKASMTVSVCVWKGICQLPIRVQVPLRSEHIRIFEVFGITIHGPGNDENTHSQNCERRLTRHSRKSMCLTSLLSIDLPHDLESLSTTPFGMK